MKSERRHELQHNSLADLLTESYEAARPYTKVIYGLVAVALALLFTFIYTSWASQQRTSKAWENFFQVMNAPDGEKKMQEIIEAHPNDPLGEWARARLAETQLTRGLSQLLKDRAAGNEALNDAVVNFTALKDVRDPDMRQRALLGLAQAHESLGALTQAAETYQALADQWKDGPYHAMAVARAKEVTTDNARAFYLWLSEYTPPLPERSTGPGGRPSFDDNSLNPFPSNPLGDRNGPFLPGAPAEPKDDKSEDSPPTDGKQESTGESPTQKLDVVTPPASGDKAATPTAPAGNRPVAPKTP